jgi:hypothetical protein
MKFRNGFLALVLLTIAAPGFAQQNTNSAEPQDQKLQRRISLNVENEKLATVFQKLTKEGVNLVIPAQLLNSTATVSITVQDQPIHDVMWALAAAGGGAWQRVGDIYVFISIPMHMPRQGLIVDPSQPIPTMGTAVAADSMPAPSTTVAAPQNATVATEFMAPMPASYISISTSYAGVSRLLSSVTDVQWERMWKRGYLRWSELSKAQRSMVPENKRKGRQTFKERGRRLVVR